MRKRKQQTKLSRSQSHRDALLRNLAQELVRHGRIVTTLPKAKALRTFIEPLVTRARINDDYAKRRIARVFYEKSVIETLFTKIAPQFIDRPGGYTRIIKLGPRQGDGAEEAVIEFVKVDEPKGSKKDGT